MRRINIQKDVESRKKLEDKLPLTIEIETETLVEPLIPQEDAESKNVQEPEDEQNSGQDDKPKKRRRTPKRDV